MKRKQFLKGIASLALLPGCLSSSSDRIKVQKKAMNVLDRACVEEAHENADVTFEKPNEAISISGITSLGSEEGRIAASVFTTKGGNEASGKDSIIVKLSPDGGNDSSSLDGGCVPILEYNLRIEFNRMPIDVLVDYETRGSRNSGFISHGNYNENVNKYM